jgi:hypothetical protein
MAASVVSFLNLLTKLEEKCWDTLEVCISCPNPSDYRLVRLAVCRCHESILYGVCRDCRDEKKSERVIENEMRSAYLFGQRHTREEFRQLINESLGQDWW